jgi:hypothetical protein
MYFMTQKILMAGAIALGAATADAATVTATYTGTVGQGFDQWDVFGMGENVVLDGKAFSMMFMYDTDIGRLPTTPSTQEVYGGWQETEVSGFELSPMVHVELRINGVVINFDVTAIGRVRAFNDGTQSFIHHYAGSIDHNQGYVSLTESSATGSINTDLTAPQEIDGSGILSPITRLDNEEIGTALNFDQGSFRHNGGEAYGSLKVEHLSITVSSVPLPGALPLFMVALMGLGMLRRRAS